MKLESITLIDDFKNNHSYIKSLEKDTLEGGSDLMEIIKMIQNDEIGIAFFQKDELLKDKRLLCYFAVKRILNKLKAFQQKNVIICYEDFMSNFNIFFKYGKY